VLQGAIDTFNWQEAATILLAILALVILGEFLSAWLRRRII
jgi:phosphonate transport system permease protein